MTEHELIEQLADKEHASWARWMNYLFSYCWKDGNGCMVIPEALVDQWQRQIDTPYAQLSEEEKQSDRNEVAHILPIIKEYVSSQATALYRMSNPDDTELRKAIMDCLPIGGADRNSGYLDIDGKEVTEMIDILVAFVKEREQAAYDRGKEAFMSEMRQGLREIIAKREHKEEP